MAIEFVCPTCGKTLKLRDEAAGKRGRCPQCQAVITVPDQSLAEDDLIEIVPADAPPAKKPPALPPKPVKPPVSTAMTPAAPEAVSAATKPCPGCGKALPEKAVICVSCGFNLKTGKKLQTVFEQPEPKPEKPATPEEPQEDAPPKA